MALNDPQFEAATAALTLRYGQDHSAAPAWNPTIAGLLAHRSVRAYLPDPLPPGTIETMVAAAQSAATSSNLQLWSVVAVHDAAARARLAELAGGQRHIVDAPVILLFVADLARAGMIAHDAGASGEGYEFLESYTVAAIDAALAAQNAVVAAESLGLGTVYIGAMRNHPEEVAALAGLPPHAVVVFGLVVGHPDPAHPASVKPRLPQEVVLHHERYDLDAQREPIARYDETARAFQTAQGQQPVGWRALIISRGRNAAALNGRDRLKAALRALGIALR
ncbi:nitroreductase family protein [Novosphingobium acidiphilum]|uniref:nitroreductase family protein n=1 Tax=Novosphingobium acidiphilum TaxID=505248 RepID=UPI0004172168|nr:nitroreductase family protein [Novosphingobium acidiphilum]